MATLVLILGIVLAGVGLLLKKTPLLLAAVPVILLGVWLAFFPAETSSQTVPTSPGAIATRIDALVAGLEERGNPEDILLIHETGDPSASSLKKKFRGLATAPVELIFNPAASQEAPFSLSQEQYKAAISAHPKRSTVLILPQPREDFPTWELSDRNVLLGQGFAPVDGGTIGTTAPAYPPNVKMSLLPLAAPERGWKWVHLGDNSAKKPVNR